MLDVNLLLTCRANVRRKLNSSRLRTPFFLGGVYFMFAFRKTRRTVSTETLPTRPELSATRFVVKCPTLSRSISTCRKMFSSSLSACVVYPFVLKSVYLYVRNWLFHVTTDCCLRNFLIFWSAVYFAPRKIWILVKVKILVAELCLTCSYMLKDIIYVILKIYVEEFSGWKFMLKSFLFEDTILRMAYVCNLAGMCTRPSFFIDEKIAFSQNN